MMDAPCTLQRLLGRGLIVEILAASLLATSLPAVPTGLAELERFEQAPAGVRSRAVGADRVESPQSQLRRYFGVISNQRLIADRCHKQLVFEALGIGKAQLAIIALGIDAAAAESLRPKVQGILRANPPDDPVNHAGARSAAGCAGILKEGQIGAGAAPLIGEEEVIDARIVLIDGFLDQAQSEHTGIKIDISLGVLGDRGDVMDSLELHGLTYSILAMSRWRSRTVKVLVVLGSFLAFLSVFTIWVERQALNTPDWVSTSDQLLQNSTIRSAVANYLVDQLYAHVNVEQELKSILPGETKRLAGPAAGGLRQVAGNGAEELLKTSTAQSLWQSANRTAHEQLVSVLEEKSSTLSTENGTVTLNLGSLVTNLASQVGIGANLAEKLPPNAGQIEILHSNQLKTAQNIAVAVKGLALLLSLLTFAAFAGAIYLAGEGRWVTVLFSGIGLIAAGFAVIVARHVAGGIVVGQVVTNESVKPAAEATWAIGTSLMTSIATTVIVVGALFAAAGWLGSPTGSARASRRLIAPALRDYRPYVYTGLAIIVGIYFLSAPTQGLRSFLTTLAVAAMAAFGIRELSRQTESEFPDAHFHQMFGRTRDRVVDAVKGANLGERASKIRLPEVRRPSAETAASESPTGVISPSEDDARLGRLERLGELHAKGVLTDDEFAAEKSRLLGDPSP